MTMRADQFVVTVYSALIASGMPVPAARAKAENAKGLAYELEQWDEGAPLVEVFALIDAFLKP